MDNEPTANDTVQAEAERYRRSQKRFFYVVAVFAVLAGVGGAVLEINGGIIREKLNTFLWVFAIGAGAIFYVRTTRHLARLRQLSAEQQALFSPSPDEAAVSERRTRTLLKIIFVVFALCSLAFLVLYIYGQHAGKALPPNMFYLLWVSPAACAWVGLQLWIKSRK